MGKKRAEGTTRGMEMGMDRECGKKGGRGGEAEEGPRQGPLMMYTGSR